MKNMKKVLIIALASITALCFAAGCSSDKKTESGTSSDSSTASSASSDASSADESKESSAETSAESSTESSSESSVGEVSVDLTAADYSNPAVTIEYGDFELIQTVTKDMQTGKYDGKVIKVTGISQKRMSSCTVMERDESTGTGYGMTYYLDGKPNLSEYPAEDAKVELLGVVTVGDYDVRALTVLPDKVTVIE